MAMTIMNNPSAMLTLGELNKNVSKLGKQLKKVSSGMRINSAGDDASGYAISERMRAQIRSLNQDTQNVQNGKSLLRIAEGGIQNIIEEIRTLKELALNAANDTNTDLDRATIQKEFDNRMANINDIATETNYNGKTLLDGTYKQTFTPLQTTTHTETITRTEENYTLITRGDYTIAADGVYMLDEDYSGTVTIADGAKNVKIKQKNSSVAVEDAFIVGPSSGNANLWIEGLNVKNSQDVSAIRFNGADNVLTLKGSNNIKSVMPDGTSGEKATVHIGSGLAVQSNSGGVLNLETERVVMGDGRAGIGLDVKEKNSSANVLFYQANVNVNMTKDFNRCTNPNIGDHGVGIGAALRGEIGDITIYGGNIRVDSERGSGIGSAMSAKVKDIIINGGATVHATATTGAAIGCGADIYDVDASANDILIDNATVYAQSTGGAAAIGAGLGGGHFSHVGVNDIYIGNHAVVEAHAIEEGGSADIGAGTLMAEVHNIIIGTSAHIIADSIGVANEPNISGFIGIITGSVSYQDLNLTANVTPPNVTEPSSGTTTTEETVTYTTTMGGLEGNPLVIHHGTKANQALNVYINDMHTWSLKTDVTSDDDILELGRLDTAKAAAYQAVLNEAQNMTLDDAKVVTQHDANVALRVIDGALQYALNEVTTVGAYCSRLDFTESNLVTANESTQASESTLRDADMAKEMAEYTKANVLAQASQSMLAQANQNSSSVLGLLQ